MNAMIFAAGVGSRLHPITNNCPKALVEIEGCPLLDIALKKMERIGVQRVVVNVHHHADKVITFLKNRICNTEVVISDERNLLMDSGGGLLKAKDLFIKKQPILLYNADIVTDIDLSELTAFHLKSKNLVTLFVQKRNASRYLLFGKTGRLCGWLNSQTGEEKWSVAPEPFSMLGYNGVQAVNYELLSYLDNIEGVFSIIPEYLRLAAAHNICGWMNNNAKWFDIGTVEKLNNAQSYLKSISDYQKNRFF
ncbi:MAG: NTP transferase domain-containing protein [Cytophagaceae bacterium]|nr:NTP transferase domain-containing protein [Cytophagaceae bacterium]